MGQQQILLIVLSVILVGVAVAVGITMFRDHALNSNKDAIIADLTNLSAKVYKFRITPTGMDGGGGSYEDLEEADLGTAEALDNDNATYTLISNEADEVVLQATGKQGATPWVVQCTIDASGNNTFETTQQAAY